MYLRGKCAPLSAFSSTLHVKNTYRVDTHIGLLSCESLLLQAGGLEEGIDYFNRDKLAPWVDKADAAQQRECPTSCLLCALSGSEITQQHYSAYQSSRNLAVCASAPRSGKWEFSGMP